MTTREKVIQLIDNLTDEQLDAEYERLQRITGKGSIADSFEDALERSRILSERLNVSVDVVALMREERDWLANRTP